MSTRLRIYLLPALALIAMSTHVLGNRHQKTTLPHERDVASVTRAFEKLIQAFNTRNGPMVMVSFTDDVILSYPGLPDRKHQAISEAFTKMFVPHPGITETWTAEIEEVQVSGDMALVRAIWTYHAERKNPDKQFSSKEKDMEIWHRQTDGSWKLARGLSYAITPLVATSKPDSKSP
ncbi:hypothetical protein BH18ACI4_BH18ACI4_21970 [soil metagenome]